MRQLPRIILGLGLLLTLTLSLAACGPGAEDADELTADSSTEAGADGVADDGDAQSVTLSAIMEEVPDTDIVLELIEEFEAGHEGITIEVEALPFDQMRDRIVTSALAPSPTYDIVVVDNPWMVDFVNGEYLLPLNDYIDGTDGYDYDDFAQPLREIGVVDDMTYGVPFYNYALSLIYRTDVIDTPPDDIEAYQEFVADASTAGDLAGLAMQPQRGYKIFEEWANWLYAYGGSLTDDSGEVILDSPEAREALEAYIATYEQAAPADSLNWGFDEALRAVAGGEAATMISYNWMLPTLNDPEGPAGDLAGEFGVAEVPGGKAALGSWSWAITNNSEQPDEAWEFISWLTSPEIDQQRVISGGAPTRMSVLADEAVWEQGFGQDYYETVAAILEDAEPLASGPNAEEVIEVVGTHLNAAVAGEETVDEAISSAAAEASDVFAQNAED
jgi:ABC-type glycerol-3-phosphate transport system substrate-binding protein